MQGYGKPIIKTFIAFGGTAHLACAADVGAGFKVAMTFNQEGIPVEVFERFSTIKLIHPRLNVSPKCGKPPLLLIRKFRLRLLLQVGQHAHKELVRAVIGSGSDGLLHKAVEFVGKLNGYRGHDPLIIVLLGRFVESPPLHSKTGHHAHVFQGLPISEQNLSEWKQGGYQDWVKHEESPAWVRQLTGEADDLAEESGPIPLSDHCSGMLAWLSVKC